MTIQIKVPELPESVADALLLDWRKQPGESVERDELLVELETDKVAFEVRAPNSGVLKEIKQPSGATVEAGDILALLQEGEPTSAVKQPETETDQTSDDADKIRMSPAVKRLVTDHGIDPSRVSGSGKDGLILKKDILDFMAAEVNPETMQEPGISTKDDRLDVEKEPFAVLNEVTTDSKRQEIREPMSRLRQTIANRLLHSQQTAALLTTFNEVDMQHVMTLRKQYKDLFEQKYEAKLGFMSFFVKASVTALRRFPLVNAYIDGTDIVRQNYNDIGIAVSSPRGLVVPVLRNCEALSFAQIETQILRYATQTRDGTISLDDLSGGTFTITNGGVFGSLLSTPIVNPPQSAILGMHKIQERPMAVDGQVVVRPMMYLALTYDHRIIDGKEAVQFLVAIKECIEDPARLLLDV